MFPRNRDFVDRRVPYFIDAEGTACAVGHLMISSGAEDIAREIATYENNDFVADIDHPELGGWLEDNGLLAAEAAWIQPSYGPCGPTYDPVCGSDGVSYQCATVATECAGVEIAYMGVCGSETEGETEADGEEDVVSGLSICEDSSEEEPREDPGDDIADDSDEKDGCHVATDSPPSPWALAGFFGLLLLRRRTAAQGELEA